MSGPVYYSYTDSNSTTSCTTSCTASCTASRAVSYICSDTWSCGTSTTSTAYYSFQSQHYYSSPSPETEKQKRDRLVRETEYRQEQERLRQERELIIKQAEDLLREHIGLEAYGELYKVGYIELDSQKYKGRKYRVKKDACRHIQVIESDKVIDELCIVPTVQCPDGDRILSKVVLLKYDEDYLLAKANHFQP